MSIESARKQDVRDVITIIEQRLQSLSFSVNTLEGKEFAEKVFNEGRKIESDAISLSEKVRDLR